MSQWSNQGGAPYPQQQYPMHSGPRPDTGGIQTSAIFLIIVGVLCTGMIPAIFGIVALAQMNTDPDSARRMNKIGWIIAIVLIALAVLFVVAYIVFVVVLSAGMFAVGSS